MRLILWKYVRIEKWLRYLQVEDMISQRSGTWIILKWIQKKYDAEATVCLKQ